MHKEKQTEFENLLLDLRWVLTGIVSKPCPCKKENKENLQEKERLIGMIERIDKFIFGEIE
jgi:hypothetical protein